MEIARKLFLYPFLAGLLSGLISPSLALEKVKIGTPTRTGAASYLPVLTAEQRGFWKENGLEVEWVPFRGAVPLMRAVAAGVLNIGFVGSETSMTAAERGVPVIMVAEFLSEYPFFVWVRTESPYRHVGDLKGRRIGVTTLGGTMHVLGRVIAKAHGVEKDVRFVGAGGIVEALAGMKAGAYEALITGMATAAKLKVGGVLREIASAADYLPKPWVNYMVFARKDFARGNPEIVKKVIRGVLQANDFMRKNPRQTIDLMKSHEGASEEEVKLNYEIIQSNLTGKIDRKGVENARRLYIEYGILTEKAPAVDELFTNEYLPG